MSEELMKIVVVGGCEIGKTALSSKYIRNEYTASYTATIGVDFGCKNETVSGTTCTLQIWDTAGPGKKLDLISLYYGGAHAILLCFDITYEASFQEAKTTFFNWIEKRAPANTPIILVGTKSDLKEDRCVLREDIDTFVNAHNNIKKYIECSAKDNIEVKKVFQTAAEYGLPTDVELKEGRVTYSTDTGAANAYIVALPHIITAYTEGLRIHFKALNANTGSSTINVDGVGAVTIKAQSGANLSVGDIVSGINEVTYNGTDFTLTSMSGSVVSGATTQVRYAMEWGTNAENSLISTAAGGDGSTDYSAL
ncbi:MAG: hypothetical protein COB50_03145, partial [Thiotrichales bacterium]